MTFAPPDPGRLIVAPDGSRRLRWPALSALLESDPRGRKAKSVLDRLAAAGHTALLVGGCVRDSVLGRSVHEFDVATDAPPERIESLFEKTLDVGRAIGVIVVLVGGEQFEAATFRTDVSYQDGRHPDAVRFCDRRGDAVRRDFTINALYFDAATGEVIDDVDGVADLSAGVVRAIGDPRERFAEDALRMMRAPRFAARLGFHIDPATASAIRRLAPDILRVSPERIQDELRKILTDERPAAGLKLLDALGLLGVIFPEIEAMKGCKQPPNYHPEGDVFVHTILSVEKLGPRPDWALALATLLHDVGKPPAVARGGDMVFTGHSRVGADMSVEICRRLRMSNEDTERVAWLVERHMALRDAPKMRASKLKRLLQHPDFDLVAALYRADALASSGDLRDYEFVTNYRRSLPPEEIRPPRLIRGDDLIAVGYRPGPAFARILTAVEDAQLEGQVKTREEALKMAWRMADEMGLKRQS